jgi:hypothetical protein
MRDPQRCGVPIPQLRRTATPNRSYVQPEGLGVRRLDAALPSTTTSPAAASNSQGRALDGSGRCRAPQLSAPTLVMCVLVLAALKQSAREM